MSTWGGRRPGSGRKPKTASQRHLDGNAGKRGRVLPHPSATTSSAAPIEEFDAPDDLTRDERLVWLELAPHAFANRTLTPATALAFKRLCIYVVLERELKAHPGERGGPNHRGLINRVDAALLRFNLSPCGKPISAEAAKPQSRVDQFMGGKR